MIIELPAALSLRFVPANWAYGLAVVFFGVFSCCMSASRHYATVMVLRFLIGCAEAWVQTGFVFLSLWYKRSELTSRCGMYLTEQYSIVVQVNNILHSLLLHLSTPRRRIQRLDSLQRATRSLWGPRLEILAMVLPDRRCLHYFLGCPCHSAATRGSIDGRKERFDPVQIS